MNRDNVLTGLRSWIKQARSLFQGMLPKVSRTYALTWEGILVILLMGVVGVAAWNSGTNLLYLVLATMIGMFLAHGLFALHFMNGLSSRRHAPMEVQAGEVVQVAVSITNTKRFLPVFALNVRHYLSDGTVAAAGFLPVLAGRRSADVVSNMVFPHRGEFLLDTYGFFSRFPFGFAQRGYMVREPLTILVFPPVFPATEVLRVAGLDHGDLEGNRRGVGVEPHSLRDYETGEHVRNIHWRTSARLGRPMVLEYVVPETLQVALRLDVPQRDEAGVWQNFEKAIVLTASLAAELFRLGYEVGLSVDSLSVRVGHGEEHLRTILRHLGQLPTGPSNERDGLSKDQAGSDGQSVRGDGADGAVVTVHVQYEVGVEQPTSFRGQRHQVLHARDWNVVHGRWKQAWSGDSERVEQLNATARDKAA